MNRFFLLIAALITFSVSSFAQVNPGNFAIRKVVVDDLNIAIEMRCLMGAVCPTSGGCDDFDFLTDLIFTLKSTMADAAGDINLSQDDCPDGAYSMDDEAAISFVSGFYLHGFSAEGVPQGFPESWTLDTWVPICTIQIAADLDPAEISLVSFDEADAMFEPGDEPNININFEDYTPEVEGVLPLNLISFTARKHEESSSLLNWSTVNEVNTSHFVIERSADRVNWEDVGKVKAEGESASARHYQFLDKNVYNGRTANARFYYRLNMVDNDGRAGNSNIEFVLFSKDDLSGVLVYVFPNPSTEGVNIELNYADDTVTPGQMVVYNDLGQVVYSREIPDGSVLEYIDYSKTNINAGAYTIQVLDAENGIISTDKLIVQR